MVVAAPEQHEGRPVVLIAAGSDASGAAGLQADLRAVEAFGVHGVTVVTAVTAQSLESFLAVEPTAASLVEAQLAAVTAMGQPAAVKIGMLGSAAAARLLAAHLAATDVPVVLDPVLGSSSGRAFADAEILDILQSVLIPRADLVTPNLPELERLTDRRISGPDEIEPAAQALLKRGARRVLVKGGHAVGELVHDYYADGQTSFWLTSPRQAAKVRGTGCSLAAVVAANLALGLELVDALVIAKGQITRGIRQAQAVGHGPCVVRQAPWPVSSIDMPWITRTLDAAKHRPHFPDAGPVPLGFYPIVDRAAWTSRLAAAGVRTMQLRIKDLIGADLAHEVQTAAELCRTHDIRLFVNDHWQLAHECGAYGVHLGQEDLEALGESDLRALANSGLRLGISTHSYYEAARAHALRPTYVALGPIFPTSCKSMRFGPQGFARIAEWKKLLPYPLVAIGGLRLEHADEARRQGADAVAVISDVTRHADPEARARAWLTRFAKHAP